MFDDDDDTQRAYRLWRDFMKTLLYVMGVAQKGLKGVSRSYIFFFIDNNKVISRSKL